MSFTMSELGYDLKIMRKELVVMSIFPITEKG